MDVFCVAVEAWRNGGAAAAMQSVQRMFLPGKVRIPCEVQQRWPKAAFAEAMRALMPVAARSFAIPFVEDLINGNPFTCFAAWLESVGVDSTAEQPPTRAGDQTRSLIRLSEGRKDGPFTSKMAAQQSVSFGLTKERHLKEAVDAADRSGLPLDRYEFLERDLRFAAVRTVVCRESIRKHREAAVRASEALVERLGPLSSQLRGLQPPTVRAVAGAMDLGLLAALGVILRWPDIELIRDFVEGLRIVGDIAGSRRRPLTQEWTLRLKARPREWY